MLGPQIVAFAQQQRRISVENRASEPVEAREALDKPESGSNHSVIAITAEVLAGIDFAV